MNNTHLLSKVSQVKSNVTEKLLKEILEVLKDIQTKFDTFGEDDLVNQFRRNASNIHGYNEEDYS